jgi:hypothetical protein
VEFGLVDTFPWRSVRVLALPSNINSAFPTQVLEPGFTTVISLRVSFGIRKNLNQKSVIEQFASYFMGLSFMQRPSEVEAVVND